jgi:cytochrome P450
MYHEIKDLVLPETRFSTNPELVLKTENFDKSEMLNMFIKESLRHADPLPVTLCRLAVKDFVLDGIKI